MKEKFKGLVLGIVIGSLLAPTVFAAIETITKELSYNDIKITMNGQKLNPTDANGTSVEPFIIEGTTYLPVRAVGNALGLNVDWDGNTNTVILSDDKNNAQSNGQVVYDEGGIKISYNGIQFNDYSVDFKFLIENNTNKGITIQARDESINDFMVSGIMSNDVQPGKKANGSLTYYKSKLEENGISSIENLEFSFHIFDGESWDTIDDSDIITIYP